MIKEKTFIPIYFDALFYKVFGEEDKKKFLIYIIEETLKVKVKSIKILNGKVLGERFSTKRAYLDLLVALNDNTKLSIEINSDLSRRILERNMLFLFKIMANDVKISEEYKDLSSFIQINLNSEDNYKKSFEEYLLMEKKNHNILTDKLKIYQINLSFYTHRCYTSSTLDKLSDFEKLMGLIGSKTQEEYDIFTKEEGMLKDIMSTADKFRDDSEIIEMYDRETEINRIKELEKQDALLKNTEEVTNKVTEEVTKIKAKDIARNMLKENIAIDLVSKVTGLTIEEVNDLKK